MTEDKQQENQAQEYDASQIQVLEGLEAVRMRPGNVYWIYLKRRSSSSGLGKSLITRSTKP